MAIKTTLFDVFSFNTYFNWRGRGFGQCSLSIDPKDTHVSISASPETQSKEMLREMLHALVDGIVDSIPDDKVDYYMTVDVPIPSEILEERKEWERIVNGD